MNDQVTKGQVSVEHERDIVASFYQLFNERAFERITDVLASDWEDIPMGPGQGPGPEGVVNAVKQLIVGMPDMKIEIDGILQNPGRAAVRGRFVGTHLGNLMGVDASGKKLEFRLYEFHDLRDGKIIRTRHLEDWFAAFQQIGAFPQST